MDKEETKLSNEICWLNPVFITLFAVFAVMRIFPPQKTEMTMLEALD